MSERHDVIIGDSEGAEPRARPRRWEAAGIAVFKIAFERWVGGTSPPDLPQLIRESFDDPKAVTAGK